MPSSVGNRRSTRVFVPLSTATESARVLRSGKRFAISEPSDWLKVISEPNHWWKKSEFKDEKREATMTGSKTEDSKKFGIVYSRKRRRSIPELNDRKFGIVFTRKQRRNKKQRRVTKLGVLEGQIWAAGCGKSAVVAFVVEDSISSRFQKLFFTITSWLRRERFRELSVFCEFLSSGSMAKVFSSNGIHFIPLKKQDNMVLDRNTLSGCGLCKIYGASEFVPIMSLEFAALPSYFTSLHASVVLGWQYLPSVLREKCTEWLLCLHATTTSKVVDYSGVSETTVCCSGSGVEISETFVVERSEMQGVGESCASVARSLVRVNGSSRVRKDKKKRSSGRNSRRRKPSLVDSNFGSFRQDQNSVRISSAAEACSHLDFLVDPVRVKAQPESCDFFSGREESDVSSPGSISVHNKSTRKRTPIEKIKELRSALAEVRQNIDSACCMANILVTFADRGWREDDFMVTLELSSFNQWCIAVKRGGVTRYLHKPQDLRPCVVNRFTHAYMWSSEDGWKLEFSDKWDWYVFKELHSECQKRNSQEDVSVKIIPVPGVREVSGYEDEAKPSFVRPDMYIHMMIDDEVERALASDTVYYDMDAADEEWLRNLNCSSSDAENGGSSCMSEENFERIMFLFEKDAYRHPDVVYDKERALDICQELGKRNVVEAVYDYWLKKRKQKRATLVRMFQGPPLRRAQFIQRPFLQKKRSFKRHRSQAERGKTDLIVEGARQEYLRSIQEEERRLQEAELAANRAVELAIQLRTRAQVLMANADLATYRSTMALKIAEAIRAASSSSPEVSHDFLSSSGLFD